MESESSRSRLPRLRLRVHVVATAVLMTLVVTLVAIFLLSMLGRFERMAEEGAQAVFDRMADANAQQLQALVELAGRAVAASARLQPARYQQAGQIAEHLSADLLAAVEVNPELYGLYFALGNGEFFQIIGVRDMEVLRGSLQAPPGTWFARRVIRVEAAGRSEHWRFLARDRSLLGERHQPAVYDPLGRSWYQLAQAAPGAVLSAPYLFQSSGAPGVTVAHRIEGVDGVLAADLSLATLAGFVARSAAGQAGGVAVLDAQDRVLAFSGSAAVLAGGAVEPLSPLASAGNRHLANLAVMLAGDPAALDSPLLGGEPHVLALRTVAVAPGVAYRVIAFAPLAAFSGHIVRARDQIMLISLLVLAISVPLAYLVSRRASQALDSLAEDSERVQALDFSGQLRIRSMFYELDVLGAAHQTMKASIRERTAALRLARDRLESLVDIGLGLSSLRERAPLVRQIISSARRMAGADHVVLREVSAQHTLVPAAGNGNLPEEELIALPAVQADDPAALEALHPAARAVVEGRTMSADGPFLGPVGASVLHVPLITPGGEVLGVLSLGEPHESEASGVAGARLFGAEILPYVEALAAQAALAIDNQNLVDGQRVMIDAVIRLVAGAIDAKSSYTGGHCERVPELAMMLAEAACAVQDGPLAAFRFESEDEWREFRIGAWLHDCGKVTTPEYVVDKATKLETLYNRIHEIRTRFELLWRDAEIARLQALGAGVDAAQAAADCAARQRQLQDDFAFVAACNIGGEGMAEADLERLQRIAGETWLRHFDDRLGLSHEELARRTDPPPALPAVEPLLADQPWHRLARSAQQAYDARYRFRMQIPPLLYHLGELHNLSVRRGTLTEEERFKINEHIIQTIIMLDQIPLPRPLRRVPEYAGTHHETLTGSGYPRGLSAEQLSIPARIMAVADIFEALTAADRPYKTAKTLSEAITLLARFRDQQHIDADVFALFLRSGVYLRYAERFLRAEQIDAVDIEAFLSPPHH